MPRIYLCDVGDIPPGRSRRVMLPEGDSLALFHTTAGFYAVKNRCPHAGARLDDGILRKDKLTCIWHGWQFNLRDGKCLNQENARLTVLEAKPTHAVRVLVEKLPPSTASPIVD